ncbi:MAG: thioredoxin family protein [Parcubacteria group bacterium]|nr:thioredoxin family protein [Parcubacteria group bacterium]|tara:strand:- start:1453 stop:1998 length:546 start_codon:yes stop_codon:yes gene_type:complete
MSLEKSKIKLETGDQAPDFSLLGIDDKQYSLADFTDFESVLIIFMCNHCPYVKAKIDVLNNLQKKYSSQLAIVGINSNDPNYPGEGMELMKEFTKEHKINYFYLLDDSQDTAKSYGATCTPDPFLLNKEHKLVFHGRLNNQMQPEDKSTEETMELKIEQLLKNEKISDDFLPSMGCSIKWL